MASIDQVISRSRQPGQFSERKRFSVARQSAIRKMRKFALADPHYYILELIQAAVANDATYIDIAVGKTGMILSYVGGGFEPHELTQIFDFLFASKDRLDLADIRQLALGINALLLAEPDQIVIESGKGTLETTTRVELSPRENVVDVGTPQAALDGTYIRAKGLRRSKLGSDQIREPLVIESRCLTAPVPVLINNESVFGYRTMRTPNIFGYDRTISFDEGDLYGTLGLARTETQNVVKLLTFGVWIESVRQSVINGKKIGGVVAFDRLRKTADHAGIVKDEVYDELWARLRPYAQQLVEGRTGRATFNIRELNGDALTATEIRDLGTKYQRLVVFTEHAVNPDTLDLATEFGRVLSCPVVLVGSDENKTLDLLVDSSVDVVRPGLRHDELEFYRRDIDDLPSRPWLTKPEPVKPIRIDALVSWVRGEGLLGNGDLQRTLEKLPRNRTIEGRVVTPVEDQSPGFLHVQVRTAQRIVWQGPVTSAYPGHVLVVDLPDATARNLLTPIAKNGTTAAELIAEVYARHAIDALSAASHSVINSLSHRAQTADNAAARIVLTTAARSTMKRLRPGDPRGDIRFVLVEDLPDEVLTYPVVKTLDGREHAVRDLERLMSETSGLLYGVIPDVAADLADLDTSRILDLDLASERAIVSLVGEASYVRVDGRDVLVDRDGIQIRDIAVGLRDYPADVPLLVEGADLGRLRTNSELVTAIVQELIQIYRGNRTGDEELRRQAARHLVWYLGHVWSREIDADPSGSSYLPLFQTALGEAVCLNVMHDVWAQLGRLPMLDGWSVDTARLSETIDSIDAESFAASPSLAMNPFVFQALKPLGWLTTAFDFDLTDAESADANATFLVKHDESGEFTGTIGIPTSPVEHPAIAVVDETSQKVWALRLTATEFGVVGRLRARKALDLESLEALDRQCMMTAFQLTANLVESLPTLTGAPFENAVKHLLNYAARHLELSRSPNGTVNFQITHPLATQILTVPLFPSTSGLWLSGERMVRSFVDALNAPEIVSPWQDLLANDAADVLRLWCENQLKLENVIVESAQNAKMVEPANSPLTEPSESDSAIIRWLEQALDKLRPDSESTAVQVVIAQPEHDRVHAHGRQLHLRANDVFAYSTSPWPLLVINPDHALFEHVRASRASPESLAWLLLAAYAYVNEVVYEVTNDHERLFQARVIDYLKETGAI